MHALDRLGLAVSPGFRPGEDLIVLVFVLAGVGLLTAAIALSNQQGRTFTAAIVYLALGAAAAGVIQALGGTPLDPIRDATLVERLTEVVVIIALFGAGVAVDRPLRLAAWGAAIRLLLVAMPLTIAAVALFGWAAMGLSVGAAVMLGAVTAPTDPVLAGDLGIGPPGEPDDEDASFALTAEAGFNDGLAYPFLLGGVLLAEHGRDGGVVDWLLADVAWALAVGVVVGIVLARGAAACVRVARDRGLMDDHFDAWAGLGVVLAVYGATELLDAYGFVAAFVAGLSFRQYERDHEMQQGAHRGAAVFERLGELAVILLLASMLTVDGLAAPGPAGWALVVLLLVVVRPLAALVALVGAVPRLRERLFIALFGVRGIGSLFYAAAAVRSGALPPDEARIVLWTAIALIVVSIAVHGAAGDPARRRVRRVDAR